MRDKILLIYRVIAVLFVLCAVAAALGELGLIDITEPTKEPIYTVAVMIGMLIAFTLPVAFIFAIWVLVKFRRDWRIMLPALVLCLSGVSIFWPSATDTAYDAVVVGLVLFGLSTIWAGWISKAPAPES